MESVKLEKVSFAYDVKNSVIENINLAFQSGTATAIVGQNGAGKTTTVKLINRLLVPQKGHVFVNGEDTRNLTTAKVALKVGYSFQNPDDQIFNNSIRKEIEFGPKKNGITGEELEKHVQYAAKLTGLMDSLNEHPYNFPYSLRKFITIASIIAMDPDIYIFDEPTAGQDSVSRQKLASIIEELVKNNKCVIVITHDMNFVVENFKRVVVLSKHMVLRDGTPEEIFTDKKLMNDANIEPAEVISIAQQVKLSQTPLSVTQLVDDLVAANGKE